jgi:hypothetical protein
MHVEVEQNHHLVFKKELFSSAFKDFRPEQFTKSLILNYHGLLVKFWTQDTPLLDCLKKYFPLAWQVNETEKVFTQDIFCHASADPQFENFSPYEIFQDKDLVIQRDFVAQEKDHMIWTMFDHQFDRFADGFHNCMRWLLFRKLLPLNKLCLHSSVVINKERAFVFLGPSGAGKSTLTKLSLPRKHLGDDMNILSLSQDVLMIEAALLGQAYEIDAVKGRTYPVAGFFWLQQHDQNELVKLDQSESVFKIVLSAPGVEADDESYQLLLDFSARVASLPPFYQLKFKKDHSLWELINEHFV